MQVKYSKRTVLWIVPLLLIGALFIYFKPETNTDQYIQLAKELVIPTTSEATFGQSLATCTEENWEFFETNRGQKVVEFSGKCQLDEAKTVNLQFLIDDDKASIGALLIDYDNIPEKDKPQFYEQLVAAN